MSKIEEDLQKVFFALFSPPQNTESQYSMGNLVIAKRIPFFPVVTHYSSPSKGDKANKGLHKTADAHLFSCMTGASAALISFDRITYPIQLMRASGHFVSYLLHF